MPPAPTSWPIPPRRRVYLMRHGEVDYFDPTGRPFRPDLVPLTSEGEEQARLVGQALAAIPFDRALTSGLVRTSETARLVLAGRPVQVEVEPRLREIETGRMSEWEKAPQDGVRQSILEALGSQIAPEVRFLAGETFASCQQRVRSAWDDLIGRDDWRSVLVVAHGIVNRILLCQLLGAPLTSLGSLEQDAGCVNLVELDGTNTPLVRLVNATIHDPGKEKLTLTTFEVLYAQYLRGRPSPSQG